jgi:hypothetical protein
MRSGSNDSARRICSTRIKTGQAIFSGREIRSFRGGGGFVSETRYIDIIKLFDRLLLAAVLLPLAGGVSAQSIADRFIGAYSAAE